MGQRVLVILGAAALAAACGDSEGSASSHTAGGASASGGSAVGGTPSQERGGAAPSASGGEGASRATGGRAAASGGRTGSGASPSAFGGLDNSTGGTGADGGQSNGGSDAAGSAGAPEDPGCPLARAPGPDPDDAGSYDGSLAIVLGLESELGAYSVIDGDLTIGPSSPPSGARIEDIDLSHLRVVEGDLLIRNTGLTTIDLPRLERVGGQLWISLNDVLTEVRAPELESAESLYLDTNVELRESDFSRLAAVPGTLYIHRNVELVSWGLDALSSVGAVIITANPALPQCLVDALNAATGQSASSEATGGQTPPDCDCPEECGRIVPDCG